MFLNQHMILEIALLHAESVSDGYLHEAIA